VSFRSGAVSNATLVPLAMAGASLTEMVGFSSASLLRMTWASYLAQESAFNADGSSPRLSIFLSFAI
jgi:hypothetical protein